ncbi:MAG TPA: DUF4328 domain-containing protein [Actinomycetota bacterium]
MRPDSSSGSADRFVSLRWRSIVVQVGLASWIVISAILAGLIFIEIGIVDAAIEGRPFDLDALLTNSDRAAVLAGASLVVLIATIVAWWVWQYRGQANLFAAGRRGLDHRTWGAVGWWLVPIANLWMPFKTVRELWKASEPIESPSEWMGVPTWRVLGWWWALWIATTLFGFGFETNETEDLSVIRTDNYFVLVGLAISVFAACLAIGVVRQITERQRALSVVLTTRPLPSRVDDVERSQEAVPSRPDVG